MPAILSATPSTSGAAPATSLTDTQSAHRRPYFSCRGRHSATTATAPLKLCAIFTLALPLLLSTFSQHSQSHAFVQHSPANVPPPPTDQNFSMLLEPQVRSNNANHNRMPNNNSSHHLAELQAAHTSPPANHTFKSLSIIDGNSLAGESERPDEALIDLEAQPIFDFGMPRNITGRTGQAEATLKCRVDMLNDKSVSWIRKRDLHILTVGTATYTSDKRFEVTASKDAREWTLHVKAPQLRDSGIYECQVNTEPKMSMAFQLNVIEISPDAKAVISGPADLHFKVGSAIILNCMVQQPTVKHVGPIYWYRGVHMITPFSNTDEQQDEGQHADTQPIIAVPRHGAGAADADVDDDAATNSLAAAAPAVDDATHDLVSPNSPNSIAQDFASRIAMESQLGDVLKSRLRISNAQTTDTGNYTCQPTTASSASVMVHVINDENPAAMQKSSAITLHGFVVLASTTGAPLSATLAVFISFVAFANLC